MHPFRVTILVIGLALFLIGGRAWYVSMTVESQSINFAPAAVATLCGAALTLAALWWPKAR